MSILLNNRETLVETLPILYGKSSKDQSKIWISRILIDKNGDGIYEIEHGNENGKLQLTRRVITDGKNIGKKNETTPLEQCTAELHKKWLDKQNKEGYWIRKTGVFLETEIKATNHHIAPMLAQTYNPNKLKTHKKNDIIFPCYIQPKLDGLRCIIYLNTEGKIVTQSRTGGIFEHMSHIIEEITIFLQKHPNIILDGELYTSEISFESLAGLIKKKKINKTDIDNILKIQYHIYDFIDNNDTNATFEKRNIRLNDFKDEIYNSVLDNKSLSIKFVKTYIVQNISGFKEKFQEFISAGYEGAMLRNSEGIYKQNYRSSDLQKYKEFQEDEFVIVDYKQGDGRDKGTVIWICKVSDGVYFNVRPKGTIEYRSDLYKNGNKYIGSKLTVIFQELTELGIPRFPVGKCIREDGI